MLYSLKKYWYRISYDNVPKDLVGKERNTHIVSNQAGVLGLAAISGVGVALFFAWLTLLFIDNKKYFHYIFGAIPFGINFIIALTLFLVRSKFKNLQLFSFCFGATVAVNAGLASIFYGSEYYLELITIPLIGAGIYIFWEHKKWLLFNCSAGIIGTVSIRIYNTYFPPIFPLEEPGMKKIFIFISLFGISLGTTLIFYYITSLSIRFEDALHTEKRLSENLLKNILPDEIATELKLNGKVAPKIFSSATVLFTDFVGFTRIAENLTPNQLVEELDKCFSYFDQVVKKYKLEKLKTIGDSFMCAGGIPVENKTHTFDAALAAMEIQAFMNQMKAIKESQTLPYWELRLGIHSGPIVAGVIGEHKFAYDVWGDTVNTASRLESSGTPGQINISSAVYDQLKWVFECEYRGQIPAKNKGSIQMYYLRRIKGRFARDPEGRVPNDEYFKVYNAIAQGGRFVPKQQG